MEAAQRKIFNVRRLIESNEGWKKNNICYDRNTWDKVSKHVKDGCEDMDGCGRNREVKMANIMLNREGKFLYKQCKQRLQFKVAKKINNYNYLNKVTSNKKTM